MQKKSNKNREIKYEALDIEVVWIDSIAKPICIAITSGDKVHYKKVSVEEVNSSKIINFLLEKCSSRKIYYVHNLSFEMFVFINYLQKLKIEFKLVSANRVVYAAEIKFGSKKIKLKCSYRMTMLRLKDLALLAGEKEKGIFPYKILDENLKERMIIKKEMFRFKEEYEKFIKIFGKNVNTYRILEEYCKNDAEITKKSIIKYWEIIREGGLEGNDKILTAAKLSIENYFKENKIIKRKIPLIYDRLLRPYYFGGRTEVFGNPHEGEVMLHYDWSGMYAQCMCEKVLGGEIMTSDRIENLDKPGFYFIKFEQNLNIPVLPIKRKKLLFVNGTFEGWYWFEEILLAIEQGVKIIEVTKVITTQYYSHFMKDFIFKNNEIRKKGGLYKQIGKNNNNTLYGRMGMDPMRLEEEITNRIENLNEYEKIIEINGVFLGYKRTEKKVSNVMTAALITAKARVKLYRGIIEVEKIGGRIMYTDTDSIIASFPIDKYEELLDKEWGEVYFDSKKGDTIIIDAVFAMPKTYAVKYKDGREYVKIKGFNARPNYEEFKETFYRKGEISTINTQWSKKDFNVKMEIRSKKTALNGLDKRKWTEDLKNTKPLNL